MPSPLMLHARRITCQRWQPAAAEQYADQAPTNALLAPFLLSVLACAGVSRWFVAHAHCLAILLLLLASGFHAPLLVTAAAAAAGADASATNRAGASSTGGSGSGGSAPTNLKPHIVLLSLPWRGHMTPLINLGRRLVQRGFHVSMGVATADAAEFLTSQVGNEFDRFTAGNQTSCANVRRPLERQPVFSLAAEQQSGFNATEQASLHPGARLVDLFSAPRLSFQDTTTLLLDDAGDNSADETAWRALAQQPGPPNGVSLLMRTFAAFQRCMGATLLTHMRDVLLNPATYEARWAADKAALRVEVPLPKGVSARERKAREALRLEREKLVPMVDVPRLFVIDRFAFGALDAARALGVPYVLNNAQLLLDIDSPNWSLPTPWSYLPPSPPLSMGDRVANVFHRLNYRATMLRALELINSNRAMLDLPPLADWAAYTADALVFTNTVWGVELHRSADAQGMHSYRNANPAANGYSPRFRMTGPLLPYYDAFTRHSFPVPQASALIAAPSPDRMAPTIAAAQTQPAVNTVILPRVPESVLPASLALQLGRWKLNESNVQLQAGNALPSARRRRIVYVNLGDGHEITSADLAALFAGFAPHADSLRIVLSLPSARAQVLQPASGWPSFVLHVPSLRQFDFLAFYSAARLLAFVITHASLANIQESLATATPVLLLPHPAVDQHEVAARFVRSGAVRVLQRVQLNEANAVRDSVARMLDDPSYATAAQQLAPLFMPSAGDTASHGTGSVVAQLELVYRTGWSHLLPPNRRSGGDADSSLPFYSDDPIFGLPLDVLALLAVCIALALWFGKHLWAQMQLWSGGEKKWQ